MKYVKIKAKNYNEALMQLRMEHGDEAIPISHKYVKEGGILNSRFFAKDVVELTAAIQEKKSSFKKRTVSPAKRKIDVRVDSDVSKNIYDSSMNNLKKEIDKYNVDKQLKSSLPAQGAGTSGKAAEIMLSSQEYSELKKIEKQYYEVQKKLALFEKKTEKVKIQPEKVEATGKQVNDIIDELKPYKLILEKNDFEENDCQKIIGEVKKSLTNDELTDKVKIEKTLKELVKSRIIADGAIKAGKNKKIVMFVGPTGVGKTTSLAKLGALFSLREGKKVSFVTIDTYRIAATEQLKKYAEIMKIPISVVNEQKELAMVVEKDKSDIIMIDTSGRSHKNKLKISEIKSFADQINYDFEKILCVSATTKKDDLKSIFESFDDIDYNSVLITKADETNYLGNVIIVADEYNKPISYVAHGQEVPNDIFVAEKEKIVDMMIINE